MNVLRRNIELKIRCADLDLARTALQQIDARFERTITQLDTYFRVGHGRLKLREMDRPPAELIWYDRPDGAQFRDSHYIVAPVSDPIPLKAALVAANGVRGEVRKKRDLWMYHNVRIHLDVVANLGNFIEFEAVMSDSETDIASQARLDVLHSALQLQAENHESRSYSDLLGI